MAALWAVLAGVMAVGVAMVTVDPTDRATAWVKPQDWDTAAMSPELSAWRERGGYLDVLGWQMWAADIPPAEGVQGDEVYLLVHGFPTSSFDWYKAVELLRRSGRVVVFDHVGFGLSEKPAAGFSFSLHEHAENMVEVWRQLGVTHGHVVSHDMGDSVVTELLSRVDRAVSQPPVSFEFFDSVVFTNGGMRVELINFRVSQILLKNPVLGPWFSRLSSSVPASVRAKVFKRQVSSLWGDAVPDEHELELMIEGVAVGNGTTRMHDMIYYLHDRYRFQDRWMQSIKRIVRSKAINIRFVWFDGDAVSPLTIPCTVQSHIEGSGLVEVVHGPGHWAMLETPQLWVDSVVSSSPTFDCGSL